MSASAVRQLKNLNQTKRRFHQSGESLAVRRWWPLVRASLDANEQSRTLPPSLGTVSIKDISRPTDHYGKTRHMLNPEQVLVNHPSLKLYKIEEKNLLMT